MINSGAPLEDDINNPGCWNLYSFTPKCEKGKYTNHQTTVGGILVFENSEGERCVGNWKFHYNRWWASIFDKKLTGGDLHKMRI